MSLDALSLSEKRVARLVAQGESNSDIAEILKISKTTVKNHLRSCVEKMEIKQGGSSRVRLARKIWEEGTE